jgi:hypothetical protein
MSFNNMTELIRRLPLDVVRLIIPYTYEVQDKSLLNDIVNYKECRTKLLDLYHQFWIIENQMTDPEEDKNWLINDIFAYANNYKATMFGYVDQFYNIFLRNKFLLTNTEIDNYVSNLEKKDVSIQINIFLGLLKKKEREDIIENFIVRNGNGGF